MSPLSPGETQNLGWDWRTSRLRNEPFGPGVGQELVVDGEAGQGQALANRTKGLRLQPAPHPPPPSIRWLPCHLAHTSFPPLRYLEAVGRLKAEGRHFPRTIHMTFVPGGWPGRAPSGREGVPGNGSLISLPCRFHR